MGLAATSSVRANAPPPCGFEGTSMASCPKCGKAKIVKGKDGLRKCPRHGPLPTTKTQGPTP